MKEPDGVHAIRNGIAEVGDPMEDGWRLGFGAEENLTAGVDENEGHESDEALGCMTQHRNLL